MTDHLPECPVIVYEAIGHRYVVAPDLCICWRLRAAEERVTNQIWGAIRDVSQYQSGFEGGLDAAHDAVAATPTWDYGNAFKARALAAIDALKDKP